LSNLDTCETTKPFDHELDERELDRVAGGGAKNTTTKNTTEGPTESLSLNFTKISWTYTA
jgi:hypothetical protein